MSEDRRLKRVRFVDERLFKAYQALEAGRHEERRLAESLRAAIQQLKHDSLCGIKIPRELWPAEYVRRYGIDNLRKYNLSDGWRLIYTLVGDEVEIISVLLEWFDHKGYAKRFGYKSR